MFVSRIFALLLHHCWYAYCICSKWAKCFFPVLSLNIVHFS